MGEAEQGRVAGPLPPAPVRSPAHPLARLALGLSILALVLTLPALPDFTFEALGSNYTNATSTEWTFYLWLAAPIVGISSLILEKAVRWRLVGSFGRLSGLRELRLAKIIAWVAAASWGLTFIGAAAVGL